MDKSNSKKHVLILIILEYIYMRTYLAASAGNKNVLILIILEYIYINKSP